MNTINFISINVKCPHCGASMMDHIHKIDHEPSIKMLIDSCGNKGNIWLSSIYGSYNYLSDIEITEQELTVLSCPSCKKEFKTQEICNLCQAPMASLILDMGGKISFCTRKGCQNHNIGFDDLSQALKKFYTEFGLRGGSQHDQVYVPGKEKKPVKTIEEEHNEVIETGTFMQAYCPVCKKSLIVDEQLKLQIVNEKGAVGYIMISPYLNVFSSKSTIFLPENRELQDIRCFHCEASLKVPDKQCEECGTAIAKILVSARSKMIDFYICSKKGCYWHGLSKDDMENIKLDDSMEW